jgi:hypothetical protein
MADHEPPDSRHYFFQPRPLDPASYVAQSEKQGALTRQLLSGDALYETLIKAVEDLNNRAPPEHDVLVDAFGITVISVAFMPPHAFLLTGYDDSGNTTSVVAHFSQLITRVIYLPKKGPDRVVTGFSRATDKPAN